MPSDYRRWAIEDYAQGVQDAISPFVAGQQDTLYLHGTVGSGKSCLAAAALAFWRACYPAIAYHGGYPQFVTPDFFRASIMNFDTAETKMDTWKRASILVLDDLGSLRGTPHVVENLMRLIGVRYENNRPMIATSNLALPQLAEALDARIASRFQRGIVLDLGNIDRRATA